MFQIYSWNVNGIRASLKKGMWEWFQATNPEIFCLQEIKAHPEQLEEYTTNPKGYHVYWNPAEKKGYSGVATFTKKKPLKVENLQIEKFDSEGRVQILYFKDFILLNCYFPNSQEAGKRLDYKLEFCDEILTFCNQQQQKGKNIILCGDYNIAHTEIDLKNPKTNRKNPGFLPEERAWMDKFIANGYVDTFRQFNPDPGHYSWWSYRFQARSKDIGWRIDYHCVNEAFASHIKEAGISKEVLGSDHCPVSITLK